MLASCQNQLISSRYLPSNAERWKPGSVPRTLPKASPSGPGIALLAADGVPNSRIAREVGVSRPTVMLWRQRFLQGGPSALTEIAPGRGRRVTYGADRVNEVVQATTQTKPPGATHWSTRTMAKAQGLSKATVQRIWSPHGLQPHRDEAIQALQGPAVHRETHRRSGAVPQSSRQSPWSCAWMRRAKSRPFSVPSPACL